MNPSYPSPEDSDFAGRSTQIEQRLKQLQPRPVNFNAETIVDAAREADRKVTLPDRTTRERNERTARWLTLSAACVCSAVAGSLLTCLVLIHGDTDDTATIDGKYTPQPKVDSAAKNDESKDIMADSPREDFHPDYQWSRSERLVSAQLLEMRGPRLTGEPPLMAGNYMLHLTSSVPPVEELAIDEPKLPADSRDSTRQTPDRVSRPTSSIDREQLLREILGVGPGSRL